MNFRAIGVGFVIGFAVFLIATTVPGLGKSEEISLAIAAFFTSALLFHIKQHSRAQESKKKDEPLTGRAAAEAKAKQIKRRLWYWQVTVPGLFAVWRTHGIEITEEDRAVELLANYAVAFLGVFICYGFSAWRELRRLANENNEDKEKEDKE
jgi:hypothetical protein